LTDSRALSTERRLASNTAVRWKCY
jgi:hypothetical protein